jgi:Carbamoyl-phosphate synthetase large chain, oligomerisation domain
MTICNLRSGICNQAQRGAGFTIEEIFNLTKIDRWFLVQIKEIVDFEEELAGATA